MADLAGTNFSVFTLYSCTYSVTNINVCGYKIINTCKYLKVDR